MKKFLLVLLILSCLPAIAQTTQWGDWTLQGSMKLNNYTASTVPYLDASKVIQSSAVTPTELAFVHGVTSALCGINQSCTFTNKIMSGSANTFSNIAYASLILTGSIVNADVSNSAAIAYSKLSLGNSVVNADIATGAAIARTKLATGTANRLQINDGSGNLSDLGSLGTTTTVLHGNASGAATYGAVDLANDTTGVTAIASGGTGQTSASNAINALVPTQTGNSGKFLSTNGSAVSWQSSAGAGFIAMTRQIFKPEGTTTTGALTSGNACIATPANLNGINIGAGITDTTTGANITNGTYVLGIGVSPCSAGQIKMSANAAGSGATDTLVFGANKTTTATISSGTACLTSVGSTAGVAPGAYVYDVTNTSGKLAVNAVVVAVPGTCSAGQIQVSANSIGNATGDTVVFSGGQYNLPTPTSPLYLRVIGAGGGGGGCSTNGQPTYFGSVTLLAATGGIGNGGLGGTASSTLINSPQLVSGGTGSGGFPLFASGAASGAMGGSNPFGGAGGGSPGGGGVGYAGAANTGAGGGSNGVGVGGTSSQGGSAGGYFNGVITSPSSTYLFYPGLGGTGGGCGNGGTGVVIVEEHYQ